MTVPNNGFEIVLKKALLTLGEVKRLRFAIPGALGFHLLRLYFKTMKREYRMTLSFEKELSDSMKLIMCIKQCKIQR